MTPATETTTTTAAPSYELTIMDQMGQIPEGYAIQADPDNTPAEVLDHLVRDPASHLPAQARNGGHLAYDLAFGDRKLIRDQPLGTQSVPAGATLTVLNKNVQGAGALEVSVASELL